MARRPKDIGTEYETASVRYLSSRGKFWSKVRRNPAASPRGDLGGLEGLATCELKACKTASWQEWLVQVRKEADLTGDSPWIFWKRTRKPIAESLVATRLDWWCEHMEEFAALKDENERLRAGEAPKVSLADRFDHLEDMLGELIATVKERIRP